MMIRIHFEIGPRRFAEAKAGTQEQGRELALAYMWQFHMQTGPRMDAKAIAGTAQIHCGRGLIPRASIVVACVGGRGEGVSLSTRVRGSTEVGN